MTLLFHTLLAQTTQPELKVEMPFGVWDVVKAAVPTLINMFTGLPWWAYVCIVFAVVARLVFGPLGDPPAPRGGRRRGRRR